MIASTLLRPAVNFHSRGTSPNCSICGCRFQLLVKQEHQCKRCLRGVCEKCGPTRMPTYVAVNRNELHRHCLPCTKQAVFLESYRKDLRLCFGQDSSYVEEWMRKLNKQHMSYQQILAQYVDMGSVTTENTIRFKRQQEQLKKQLWFSCNYSLRNFMGLMLQNCTNYTQKISKVIVSIYGYLRQSVYVQNMIYIVMFLLCFANESHTYFILTRFISKAYPQYGMRKDHIIKQQISIVLQMYTTMCKPVSKEEYQCVQNYLTLYYSEFAHSFTLNKCTAEASLAIIDDMLRNTSKIDLLKGIASLLINVRDIIFGSHEQINCRILMKVPLDEIKATLLKLQKKQQSFNNQQDIYDSLKHQKLHQKYKQLELLQYSSEKTLYSLEQTLKNTIEELNHSKIIIKQQEKHILKLQKQILTFAAKLESLQLIDKINQQNRKIKLQYQKINKINIQLNKQIRQLQKKKFIEQKKYLFFCQSEANYTKQIIQLKTANQIYEIQIKAKQLDFNTSMIQDKLKDKNCQITKLLTIIKDLNIKLQFQNKKLIQKQCQLQNNKQIRKKIKKNMTNFSSNDINNQFNQFQKQQNDIIDNHQTLKKMLQTSKSIIEKMQKNSFQIEAKLSQKNKQIVSLTNIVTKQSAKLALSEEVQQFLKEKPKQKQYNFLIERFQGIILKETIPMKKDLCEQILSALKQSLNQIRFRQVDLKIKENIMKKAKNFDSQNYKSDSKVIIQKIQNEWQIIDQFFIHYGVKQQKNQKNQKDDCYIY